MMNDLAQKLLKAENDLNKWNSDLFPLGAINSDYFRLIYMNSHILKSSCLKNITDLVVYITKFLLSGKIKLEISNVEILLGKSGQKKHHNRLMDYLEEDYNSKTHFFDKSYKEVFGYLTLADKISIVLKSLMSQIKFYRVIKETSGKNNLRFYPCLLISSYIIQCIKFRSSRIFLQRIVAPKLLIVDYDRSTFSALVLAANSLSIKTISFQHGAINPPYGYNPLIADEIWVWGETWKKCLVSSMGVDDTKIRIVGSTISDRSFKTHRDNKVKVIGIGPNPIGFEQNFNLWNNLMKRLSPLGYNVIVKLHPSMKLDAQTQEIFGNDSKIFEYNQLSNQEFFDKIDLLIVSNSGLGYEAVLADVPVAVIRQEDSKGNDHIMISAGKFPEIIDNNLFPAKLLDIARDYSSILDIEKKFIEENIYAKVGLEARTETKRLINQYI